MKNYKVKVKHLYPGMSFYHVENTGAYMGKGTYITTIVPVDTECLAPEDPRPAGVITIFTLDSNDNPGLHYVNEDDYVYPLGEWEDVTIFTRLWWRIRQLIILFGFY